MSDESQVVIPSSFVELFTVEGRLRASSPREHIAAQYELCEDLAHVLTEQAKDRAAELGVTIDDVLERIQTGLRSHEAAFSQQEAEWVMRRVAELLEWGL